MKFLYNITKKENRFQRTVGLKLEQFEVLAKNLEEEWEKAEKGRKNYKERKRAIGAGHPYKFGLREQLLITLIY